MSTQTYPINIGTDLHAFAVNHGLAARANPLSERWYDYRDFKRRLDDLGVPAREREQAIQTFLAEAGL